MNKLYPIKSLVLRTAKSKEGETYHVARLTLELGDKLGIINVRLSKPNCLPKSWRLADGVKPVINKVNYARFDKNLAKFVPAASESQADQIDSLVGVGFAGVSANDLAAFAAYRDDVTKEGKKITFLRRTADGVLNIVPLPANEDECGIEVKPRA